MSDEPKTANEFKDQYVPQEKWGRDHWSTLAYMETVMVEKGHFPVAFDCRMRQNRRHFRIMPGKRTGLAERALAMCPEYGSRLNDGRYIPGHDDWNCIQDMANEGLFATKGDSVEPGKELRLSQKGQEIVAELRRHKMSGGTFSNFRIESEAVKP